MEKMAHFFSLKTSGKTWLVKLVNFLKSPAGITLIAVLLLASFLRLYKIADYMTFLGDEGRDAIVAKEILEGNLTLLGPRASAGDFFLGPVYYYMIAPFLWIFSYDPVGPAVMVALFGIATVFLVYYVTSKLFSKGAGLIAASLYAVSPIIIAFSRSSWNPNPMPFFSLLIIYLVYLGVKKTNQKFLFISGILLGITFQLHYIATFLAIIIFFFILGGNLIIRKRKIIDLYFRQYLTILIGFLVGFSPFLAFELKHNFPNIRTILNFIFVNNFQGDRIQNLSHFEIVRDVFFRLFARLTLNFPSPIEVSISEHLDLQILQIIVYGLAFGSIVVLFFSRRKLVVFLLSLWLLGGLFLFGFYKREIYDYYYGFLFPVPFILIGNLTASLFSIKGKIKYLGIFLGSLIFVFLFYTLVSNHPFQYPGNKQKENAEKIADFVLAQTGGKPYNFALVTVGNSDHVFRYFFEIKNHPPVVIENPQNDPERNTVTGQLLIVCDYNCEPLGNPLWEVAGFGIAEVENSWQVSSLKIYKLTHSKNQN